MENEKFQIQDVDSYEPEADVVYSHQSLIMKGMKRVYELGGLELHEGCDVKEFINGRPVIIHKPNERKQFINAISILKSGLICDFDDEIIKSLKKLDEELEESRKELLEIQVEQWKKLELLEKERLGVSVLYSGILHKGLPFYNRFKEMKLEYHRKVFEELVYLTKRKGFYAAEMVTG